jgi:hypothetical protein
MTKDVPATRRDGKESNVDGLVPARRHPTIPHEKNERKKRPGKCGDPSLYANRRTCSDTSFAKRREIIMKDVSIP